MTLRKMKKRDPKNGLTIKNDRQAMKVLGLLENNDKNKEVFYYETNAPTTVLLNEQLNRLHILGPDHQCPSL